MDRDAKPSPRASASPLLVLASAVPLLVGILLLQLFGPPSGPLTPSEIAALHNGLPAGRFVPGLLTYVAVLAVHFCACLAAIWLARDLLRETHGGRAYARIAVAMAATTMILIPLGALLPNVTVYSLTYAAFVDEFRGAGGASFFGQAGVAGTSPLVLGMLLPTWAGIAAVSAIAAAANAQLRKFPPALGDSGLARAAYVAVVHSRLKRCLVVLSIVLVTSTVAASLFFHLPGGFTVAKGSSQAGLLDRLTAFASELSFFWGCIYTLTLAAAVGLPIALFQQRVGTRLEELAADTTSADERDGLIKAAQIAGSLDQLKFVTALFAPLAAGPIANLLQVGSFLSG
jgi:hypothetical protein